LFLTDKEDGQAPDAFAQVEKTTVDKITALENKDRLEELMEFSEARNSDPFGMFCPHPIPYDAGFFLSD
jgi:hypothetical protein